MSPVTPALETHLRQDLDHVRVSPLSAETLLWAVVRAWDTQDFLALRNAVILAGYHLRRTALEAA